MCCYYFKFRYFYLFIFKAALVVAQSSFEGSLPQPKVDIAESKPEIVVNKAEVAREGENTPEKASEENQKSKKFFFSVNVKNCLIIF